MPVNQIIGPGSRGVRARRAPSVPPGVSVPTGLGRPPWLTPTLGTVEVARTAVVACGPALLRAADEPPSGPFLDRTITTA